MNEIDSPEFWRLEVRAAYCDLVSHLAFLRLRASLRAFGDLLEEKYRPDQPRAPKGTPEGGQWIADPGSARQRQAGDERVRVAGIAGDLEALGGGTPILRPSPSGATQFFFPNGMILRFDIGPGQYSPRRGPHINLEINGVNHHIYLK